MLFQISVTGRCQIRHGDHCPVTQDAAVLQVYELMAVIDVIQDLIVTVFAKLPGGGL